MISAPRCHWVLVTALALVSSLSLAHAQPVEWKFHFASGPAPAGFISVVPDTAYAAKQGYGFLDEPSAPPQPPRRFAVDLAEGSYDVTLRFGSGFRATTTTIKAESRRLMIENVETAPGRYETRTFTVNVRKPPIGTGGSTMLNTRELGPPVTPDWDEHLTLEFNGAAPGVASLEVRPAKNSVTLFIAGDSTVTDQRNEPYAGWGQMLPRFFVPGIAVSNQAESGLALHSFERQKRLAKILSMMKPGDYLFIQFGHNDQKNKAPGAGPFTTYKANLKRFVQAARGKGGIPVLVTPMERRRFARDGTPETTLSDYAEAVRQAGKEDNVSVIDLNAMSLKLYAALGPEKSKRAFVYYPAGTFPGQDKALSDDTHHNAFGGYELARCVLEGIRTTVPGLVKFFVPDVKPFDPSRPDSPESFAIPASRLTKTDKPAGS